MDLSRLGLGERIAAVAALVLLVSMYIFGWFSLDGVSVPDTELGQGLEFAEDDLEDFGNGEDTALNAWESFAFIDMLLFLACVAALVVAGLRATGNQVPSGGATAVFGLGALAAALVLFRLISPPDLMPGSFPEGFDLVLEIGRGIGAFIGLAAAAAIAYGGYLMMAREQEGAAQRPEQASPPAEPPAR